MDTVSISIPSALYVSIYERYREATGDAIVAALAKLTVPNSTEVDIAYSRPGAGTITGKVWEIADGLSSVRGGRASRQHVVEACIKEGINMNTANTQFSHWSKAPLQASGLVETWQSPDRTFNHMFLKLDLDCRPDGHAGVVILTDESHQPELISEVENLEKDLPRLLEECKGTPLVYWDLEDDRARRREILDKLTPHPVYVG